MLLACGQSWIVLDIRWLLRELNVNGIHRLKNVLTLNHDAHTFDTLQLWLEPVEAVS